MIGAEGEAEVTQPTVEATPPPEAAPPLQPEPSVFEKRLAAIEEAKAASEKRVAELEAKLEEARKPKPVEEKPDPSVAERLARLELKDTLRLRNNEQAAAVQAVIKENPKLSPAEAMAIAAQRDPKTFGRPDPRGFDPAHGGALPPGGKGAREPEPVKTTADKMHDAHQARKYRERSSLAMRGIREKVGGALDRQV